MVCVKATNDVRFEPFTSTVTSLVVSTVPPPRSDVKTTPVQSFDAPVKPLNVWVSITGRQTSVRFGATVLEPAKSQPFVPPEPPQPAPRSNASGNWKPLPATAIGQPRQLVRFWANTWLNRKPLGPPQFVRNAIWNEVVTTPLPAPGVTVHTTLVLLSTPPAEALVAYRFVWTGNRSVIRTDSVPTKFE